MNYRRSHRIKRKKPKFKKILFILFFFFAFSSSIYFFFFSDFFLFKEIIISDNTKVFQEDILMVVQEEIQAKKFQIIDNNLLLFDLNAVENNILFSFPLVSNVKIIKKFPHTINVLIEERDGVAVFCDTSNEKCFVVDWQGIVFEEFSGENQELPKIRNVNLKKDLILGNKIIEKELLATILSFSLSMKNLDIQLKEFLIISDNKIEIITQDDWRVYFNPGENIEWQLTKLNAVLGERISLEERKELEYIELRFGDTAPFKKRN